MSDYPLPSALDDFDAEVRLDTLREWAAKAPHVALRQPHHVNMHCHTFYSYNGYDASPSRVAAYARTDGWYAAGICDFDVLDGLGEFLDAGDILGLRVTVNLETRVFFKEYAAHEINSPGEPGVYYFMGAGFVTPPDAGTEAAAKLAAMRAGADARNRAMCERVNVALDPVVLDYEDDVVPLTPAGNATERHLCSAYALKAREHFMDDVDLVAFWAEKLGVTAEQAEALLANPMDLNDKIRSKMMKSGGPGYVQPTTETFPALESVIEMIQACRAIPMATWLDGTTSGEADMRTQLECLMAKGVAALNIIPDRNWNLKKPEERDLKIRKFHECVAVANDLQLPVNVGTELNKYGQRWVDDFTADPMTAVSASFMQGAQIMVGHTRLLNFAEFPYCGVEADGEFGADRRRRNEFFAAVGALPPAPAGVLRKLGEQTVAANYALLHDAAKKGAWA